MAGRIDSKKHRPCGGNAGAVRDRREALEKLLRANFTDTELGGLEYLNHQAPLTAEGSNRLIERRTRRR